MKSMLKSVLGRVSRRVKGWPYKDYTQDYEDEIRGQYNDGNTLKDESGNDLSLEDALNNIDRPNDSSFWEKLLGNNGGSLVTALVGYLTSMAGFTLTGAQREQNQFNAEQSAIQRGWEERMSNTSYQRAVDDMRIAGLNPALMYGSGASGASTPTGSAASGSSPAPAQLLDLIVQLKSQRLQAKVAQLQSETSIKTAQIAADATVTSARYGKEGAMYSADTSSEASHYRTDTDKYLTEKKIALAERELELREYLTSAQVDEINAQIDKLYAETQSEFVRQSLDRVTTRLVQMQTKEIGELLPYRQELLYRQKDVAIADYGLKMTEKFFKEGLIKGGQIDLLIQKAQVELDSAHATADEKRAAAKIKERLVDIKEGRPISHNGDKLHDFSADVVNRILGDAVELVDAIGSAIVSGLIR